MHGLGGGEVWGGGGEAEELLLEGEVARLGLGKTELEVAVAALDGHLLGLEGLDLLALALARGLRGATVAEDALDAALFLLVFGLRAFSRIVLDGGR